MGSHFALSGKERPGQEVINCLKPYQEGWEESSTSLRPNGLPLNRKFIIWKKKQVNKTCGPYLLQKNWSFGITSFRFLYPSQIFRKVKVEKVKSFQKMVGEVSIAPNLLSIEGPVEHLFSYVNNCWGSTIPIYYTLYPYKAWADTSP